MSAPAHDLLTTLLRDVSRSFYRTLRLLPVSVRAQISLAYLLARATDTIADTAVLPVEERLSTLDALRRRVLDGEPLTVDFGSIAASQAKPAEAELLQRIEEVAAAVDTLSSFDRCCIREVFTTITSGQELDLQRFHGASPDNVLSLQTDAELEDYTYRVAGCVGNFWTRLCRSKLYPTADLDLAKYVGDGVRFGCGLQLVNILRDLPSDLRQGRCYLPWEGLAHHKLAPADLLDPGNEPRFRACYRTLLERALKDLKRGWNYTCVTPRTQSRVRIACALPLLIGCETLQLLATANVLDGSQRIKVPRKRVKFLLLKTTLLHPFPGVWERLFRPNLPCGAGL